jgi:hypothetical protein
MVKRRNVRRRRPSRRRRVIKRRRLQSFSFNKKGGKFVGAGLSAAAGAVKTYYAMGKNNAAGVATNSTTMTNVFKKKRKAPELSVEQALTKSNHKVYMQKYKLGRIVHATTNRVIDRYQNISNFDTNVGAVWCANYKSNAWVHMPMLILDLGSIEQGAPEGGGPAALFNPHWTSIGADSPIQFMPIEGTNPDGTKNGRYKFQHENDSDEAGEYSHATAVLDWVNLRMNLYGQRKRTTKFLVSIVQFTQDENDIHEGSGSNIDKRALFQYLERPFIYSNLQQDSVKKKTGIKIIKEFTYNVAPMTSIDLNTATGNIHEANIFVKINKRMDYQYTKGDAQMLPHDVADGQDYTEFVGHPNSIHRNPKPRQNVYVFIRAFAPVRKDVTDGLTADDCPSIDIIARRCMTFPVA